jgi:flagellar protein FlbB
MRRLIIACELLVIVLFAFKIAVMGGILKTAQPEYPLLSAEAALANTPVKTPEGTFVKDVSDDSLGKERRIAASLMEKEKQLESREIALKDEEKKLASLKGEVMAKIDHLKSLEEKMTGLLDTTKATEDKRLKELATVFEATPPAQAGPMLEKLDKKLAAAVIMNMKSKKAGAIWAHISPGKVAEITREITLMPPSKSEQANP